MEEGKTERNKKRMIDALEKMRGNVTKACKRCGLSRSEHYLWLKNDSEYKSAVDDIGEEIKDWVEEQNYKNIAKGKEKSILSFLKTKCRDRGYGDKQDQAKDFYSQVSGFKICINRGDGTEETL
jgi:hypothetical protein